MRESNKDVLKDLLKVFGLTVGTIAVSAFIIYVMAYFSINILTF